MAREVYGVLGAIDIGSSAEVDPLLSTLDWAGKNLDPVIQTAIPLLQCAAPLGGGEMGRAFKPFVDACALVVKGGTRGQGGVADCAEFYQHLAALARQCQKQCYAARDEAAGILSSVQDR